MMRVATSPSCLTVARILRDVDDLLEEGRFAEVRAHLERERDDVGKMSDIRCLLAWLTATFPAKEALGEARMRFYGVVHDEIEFRRGLDQARELLRGLE